MLASMKFGFPSPRMIQELVQAWKQLRKVVGGKAMHRHSQIGFRDCEIRVSQQSMNWHRRDVNPNTKCN